MTIQTNRCVTPPEQMRYAMILERGAYLGILIMLITYAIYAFGILTPHVPIETVINNWHLGVHDYLKATNSPTGWDWLSLVGTGDFINFIGLVLLAVMTIICYATLILPYFRCGDFIYLSIVIAEIAVLTLAASGILGSGGH
ncbi:hypothetical protein [Halodesulfovibrio aestuarii]|uniref:DUF1634 domain-containing protein n=1 Tax=Halodesulfovibrio aestuarii TaxID=126333 RepID=A0A8G2CC54_9BACT|nr:hypothetical protein [Halodesulfovibrio aestuarii]SHJ70515.1 hypothetical protein SAMN05660830_03045 [Halodesulfovibrio aestuarii]